MEVNSTNKFYSDLKMKNSDSHLLKYISIVNFLKRRDVNEADFRKPGDRKKLMNSCRPTSVNAFYTTQTNRTSEY